MHFDTQSPNRDREERFVKSLGLSSPGASPKFADLPNLKKSDESNFWGWHATYGHYFLSAYGGHHQIEGKWATVKLFFVDVHQMSSAGFAVVIYNSERDPNGDYKHPIEYYTWTACEHEFKSKNVGRCLNRYTCAKCGDSHEIDSSD